MRPIEKMTMMSMMVDTLTPQLKAKAPTKPAPFAGVDKRRKKRKLSKASRKGNR